MEIEFRGAAREVTGSCHIVRVNGQTILLDCGLFQGRRAESEAKNRTLPLDVAELDAIVLSHAHLDHAGRLPFLVKAGYRQPIYCTPATRDLCAIMLADSAHIQEKDAEHLQRRNKPYVAPLYDQQDAVEAIRAMVSLSYQRRMQILPGVHLTFVDAGHILGSASVVLECEEEGRTTRLVFSGDIGRSGLPIIRDPAPPAGADVVIMESTYGNRDHVPVTDARERLAAIVHETARRSGKLLIPAFAVGRTQEILYELHLLAHEGRIPRIPIFVDSPLAIDATSVFELHPDTFDRTEDFVQRVQALFRFDLVRYTREASESKALNAMRGPMIVIAASGMVESGRILHHLVHGAADDRNTILIVGFQAEHTLGRRIVERRPVIRVFGDEIPLRARVEVLDGYSAHADRTELRAWAHAVRGTGEAPRQLFLVHGEEEPQDELARVLTADGFRVGLPSLGDRVRV